MLTNKGFRCDANIGKPGGQWHDCSRKANYQIRTEYTTLHYCKRHSSNRQQPRDFTAAPGAVMKAIEQEARRP